MLSTRLQGAAWPAPRPVPVLARALAAVAVGFGLLTLYSGGQVLFTEAARAAAGDYVPLVVWFNFLAGFAYVVAGIGLWRLRPWAAWLAAAIALRPWPCSPRSACTSPSAAPTSCARSPP